MPSTCCSVPHCSNRGGHIFPKDEKLKKKLSGEIIDFGFSFKL
jgi:hypothetical protein